MSPRPPPAPASPPSGPGRGRRDWWRRRRFQLPLVSAVALAAGLGVAIRRSRVSSVVVYNETGATLPPLVIRAGGEVRGFPSLAEEDSVRLRLARPGPGGAVELEISRDPPWTWRGGWINPAGGDRITLRLYPDGIVDLDIQVSIWQRLLRGDGAAPEAGLEPGGEPDAGPRAGGPGVRDGLPTGERADPPGRQ